MVRPYYFETEGRCPICELEVVFSARDPWFRDHLLCPKCCSIPRERALAYTVEQFFPGWRDLAIHESSPGGRGASVKLAEAAGYVPSQYLPSLGPGGTNSDGSLHQDLERQSFDDGSFDLVVTQDVFEHVFDIDAAFREIARTLRPGGAHVFTTPLVNRGRPTEPRATREADGTVRHLQHPEYHLNPIDPDGSLVTWNFGFDLAARIVEVASMPTMILSMDRLDLGIRAEYCEVMVSFRNSLPSARFAVAA